jgi:chorismate mutase
MLHWQVRGLRGATTATENTVESIREAVTELLARLIAQNDFQSEDLISVVFSTTRDLDAIFPAAIARELPLWKDTPLLDVQQMHVVGSLERCIRVLIYLNSPKPQAQMQHIYLRRAQQLRPDLSNLSPNG